jgi:hypothetical protein
MLETLGMLFCWALLAFGILCVIKLVLSLFSDAAWKSVRRYPLLHALGVCLVLAPFLFIYLPQWWPPLSLERSRQRQTVNSIVQTNGGWDTFRSEAARLVEFARTNQQYQWSPLYSSHSPERALPAGFPLLNALNPQEVDIRSYTFESHEKAVFVKVYGMHSTGGRGIPFYGLLYAPTPLSSPKEPVGLDALAREQIVPSVYELHR